MKGNNGGQGGRGGKGCFEIPDAVVAEATLGRSDRVRIVIDAEYARPGGAKHRGVAAAAECGIDRARAAFRPRPHRRRKDGNVVGNGVSSGRRHAPT